ncbi:MAG: SpoIID/LytB domain-containing protein [Moorellales bacterium]
MAKGEKPARGAVLLLLGLLLVLGPGSAWAQETLRVGLGTAPGGQEVKVCRGSFEIVDLSAGALLAVAAPGSVWRVSVDPAGLKLSSGSGPELEPVAGPIEFRPVSSGAEVPLFSVSERRYRGSLRLEKVAPGDVLAVNLVDLEEYLSGVVGEEMGYGAPVEALKAQAVASRSYALARKASQATRPYDVGTDQSTQVYAGYEAETKPGFDRVKAAVEATRGEVMYYRGQLVEAYFHSNAGGHTENSENVWQRAIPYLRGVPSPWDSFALRQSADPSAWPANTYQWEKIITRDELSTRVANWNVARAAQPEQQIRVGEITVISPVRLGEDGRPTVSGRAARVLLVGREGQQEIRGETARSLLGLRSTLFELHTDARVFLAAVGAGTEQREEGESLWAAVDGGVAPVNPGSSTYWVLGAGGTRREVPKVFTRLEFSGRGYGHGVGMSQWGARGMAAEGYGYRDILEYYYNQNRKDGSLTVAPYRPAG